MHLSLSRSSVVSPLALASSRSAQQGGATACAQALLLGSTWTTSNALAIALGH